MSQAAILAKHQIEAVLVQAADEVEIRLAAFFDDPNDPETMHKLRVSIRTLRSLCRFVSPWQVQEQNTTANYALRDVVRETSRLRELDVFEEQVRAMEPAPAEDLVAAVSEAASEERARVLKVLQRKKTKKLLLIARDAVRAVHWVGDIPFEGIPAEEVQNRFEGLVKAQDKRYAKLDRADAEATHTVRKRAKEVRYAASKFAPLLTEDAKEISQRMKAEQDELGALCDARVNVDLILSFPSLGLSVEALRNLAEALAANYAVIDEATRNNEQ